MKVLAVEDEPVAQLLLESALKSLGHEVTVVADGEAAWAALSDPAYRVVVSDWRVPKVDGLELCRRVRERGGDYVSFILITQLSASDENVEAALAVGVDDFLSKPVNVRDLRIRLHVAERLANLTGEVNRLASFLPICAHCRKVRDDGNYWLQIEQYINERTGTRFSHGICPDCYDRVAVPAMKALGIDVSPKRKE